MSGVYVKGLGMPKDGEHPYWVTIHSDGTVEYNENKGQGWQTSEATPVPDHGSLCDRCDKYASCLLNYDGPACRRNRTTQPTNADRIRAMSDEELAEFFGMLPCCPTGTDLEELCYPLESCEGTDLQVKCWLKWLKKEADNG